jgi:hypothetical protein
VAEGERVTTTAAGIGDRGDDHDGEEGGRVPRAGGTAWPDSRLDELRRHGDPELDGLIAELIDANAGSVLDLYEATVRAQMAVDPELWPPALLAWWERPALPGWVDPGKVARAAAVAERWLPELLTSYLVGSLPQSYAGARGAKVLTRISLLGEDEPFVRRVLETLLFVLRVVEPGALDEGGTGYELARKTRVFHSIVRAMVGTFGIDRRRPDGEGEPWDEVADGVPVNQEDLLGTLWTFAVTPLQVIERAAIPVEDADKDAVVHLWSVVGHLLGVGAGCAPGLLPMTYAEAAACWSRIQAHQFGPSDDGRALTDVLVRRCRDLIPLRILKGLPEASVFDTLGPEVAGYVGVERGGPVRHLLVVNRLAFRLANRMPGGELLRRPVRHFAKRFALEWLSQQRAGDRPAPVLTPAQRRRLMPLYVTRKARRAARAATPTAPAPPAPSTPATPDPSP